jgi:accessory colonization factor AcfC
MTRVVVSESPNENWVMWHEARLRRDALYAASERSAAAFAAVCSKRCHPYELVFLENRNKERFEVFYA